MGVEVNIFDADLLFLSATRLLLLLPLFPTFCSWLYLTSPENSTSWQIYFLACCKHSDFNILFVEEELLDLLGRHVCEDWELFREEVDQSRDQSLPEPDHNFRMIKSLSPQRLNVNLDNLSEQISLFGIDLCLGAFSEFGKNILEACNVLIVVI